MLSDILPLISQIKGPQESVRHCCQRFFGSTFVPNSSQGSQERRSVATGNSCTCKDFKDTVAQGYCRCCPTSLSWERSWANFSCLHCVAFFWVIKLSVGPLQLWQKATMWGGHSSGVTLKNPHFNNSKRATHHNVRTVNSKRLYWDRDWKREQDGVDSTQQNTVQHLCDDDRTH